MAIQTTGWLGTGLPTPKSGRISYDAGTVLADLIQAVEDLIVTQGWELWDVAAGANARAYRAPCIPDINGVVEYKYAVLDYNTANYLFLKCYESWDNVNHIGLNLAYLSGTISTAAGAQPIGLVTGGKIYIAAGPRKLLLCGEVGLVWGGGTDSGPVVIVETTRWDSYWDSAAIGDPKFVWISIGTAFANAATYLFSAPRYETLVNNMFSNACISTSHATAGGNQLKGVNLMPDYASRSGKFSVSPLSFDIGFTYEKPMGVALGLVTTTKKQGSYIGDDISFPVKAGYGGEKVPTRDVDGVTDTWWLIGNAAYNGGRVAVEK